jgi:hypothetical protein
MKDLQTDLNILLLHQWSKLQFFKFDGINRKVSNLSDKTDRPLRFQALKC